MKIAPSATPQVIEPASRPVFVGNGSSQTFEPPDVKSSQIVGEFHFELTRNTPRGKRD